MPKPVPDARATLIGCPSCSGVLSVRREHDTRHLQFICSIGHTFSLQTLLEAKENQVETGLWSLISLLEHIEMIMEFFLKQVEEGSLPIEKEGLLVRREQARNQAAMIRKLIEETQAPDLDVRRS